MIEVVAQVHASYPGSFVFWTPEAMPARPHETKAWDAIRAFGELAWTALTDNTGLGVRG